MSKVSFFENLKINVSSQDFEGNFDGIRINSDHKTERTNDVQLEEKIHRNRYRTLVSLF